ncbi:unnamed protein product [Mytilus coruscus]|uniref:C2H2-type domain-containing protein n=1 Tax=Mytilus coruscus TaxID=42192 RepID=A0A6J8DCY2_MYTCO|nr:unnamed protein product [Mytilus coruscus]
MRNLTRHGKKNHSKTREHWNCTEDECVSKFTRKEYLFRHLSTIHHISKPDARRKALKAKRRDIEIPYISDDTILDLIKDLSDIPILGKILMLINFYQVMKVKIETTIHYEDMSLPEMEQLFDENNTGNMCENFNVDDFLSSDKTGDLMERKMPCKDISSPDATRAKRRATICDTVLTSMFMWGRNTIVTHILVYHISLARFPYYCTLCQFRCTTLNTLQHHVNFHRPHQT